MLPRALAEQHLRECGKDPLAPDAGVHLPERSGRLRHTEEVVQVGKRPLESWIEAHHLQSQLFPPRRFIVLVTDLEITVEERDERKVGSRLAVRYARCLEEERIAGEKGFHLVEEPGLADARVADDGDDVPSTLAGEGERSFELRQLPLASDEAHEPTPSRELDRCAFGRGGDHLVGRHGLAHALYRDHSERTELEVALGKAVGALANEDRVRSRETLHASGEVRRVTDWVILGVQVVLADRPQ